MENVVHNRAKKTVEQTLREICTPQQFAIWKSYVEGSKRSDAVMAASSESVELGKLLKLTDVRQQQVFNALYKVDLASKTWANSSAELALILKAQADAKENALKQILTLAEFVTYQEYSREQLQRTVAPLDPTAATLDPLPSFQLRHNE